MKRRSILALLAATLPALLAFNPVAVESEHYLFKTDVPRDQAREAFIRLDRAFESYAYDLRGRGQPVDRRLNAAFFAKREDMLAYTKDPRIAAMFVWQGENQAIVFAMSPDMSTVWGNLQHEAFHQYVRYSVGELPQWLDEGIAEYYEAGIFTGDGYELGGVDPRELADAQALARLNSFVPYNQFVAVNTKQWIGAMNHRWYVQAWSMVYFLMHANNGEYKPKLESFMARVAKATERERASEDFGRDMWRAEFGNDFTQWEGAWKRWLAGMKDTVNVAAQRRANVRTILSLADRARIANARFTSFAELTVLAAGNRLSLPQDQVNWLPPQVLKDALVKMDRRAAWTLTTEDRPVLTVKYPDGMTVRARYAADGPYKVTFAEIVGEQAATRPSIAGSAPGAAQGAPGAVSPAGSRGVPRGGANR
jgi:hypothetical protein